MTNSKKSLIQSYRGLCSRAASVKLLILVVGFCCVAGHSSALAGDATIRELKDGVAVSVGGDQVELTVATPHSFRLRVHPPSDAPSSPSIFLSGQTQPAIAFSLVHEGDRVGIKTGFGELNVDVRRQEWSMTDAKGVTLIDWAALKSKSTGAEADASAGFALNVGPSSPKGRRLFYGSGNDPKLGKLTQEESHSHAGNGSTSLPQYWSNAGYGALLVTRDDNKPATWKADGDGGVRWQVRGPLADLYLAPARNLYEWLLDDAELTGFAPVPPRWTFGYMQSRWGWKDRAYIDETLARFRADHLPVDAFIFDFEWYTKTPDYKVKAPGEADFVDFEWYAPLFPDPAKQIAAWSAQGLYVVGIRKPRIGNSGNLSMARSKGWILPSNPEDPNGEDIKTRNLDYANPAVQAWWQENNRKFIEAGMAGFWNDEGETTYTEYSYWNLTEAALCRQVDPNARFWSLNRSFAPGLQRFGAAAWTGDIHANWETLNRTTGELLTYSLSGMPYMTCDIGGFFGDPSPELLTRWMQAGVFFPIQRSHSHVRAIPRFPWLFGAEAEDAIRKSLELRYRLIPYYYSLAFENNETAVPLMRPVVMEFPDDEKVAQLTDEWLMGKGLLAAPVLQEGGKRTVYLPDDRWYNFGTNQITQGPKTVSVVSKLDEIPVYLRAGTLLPLGPVLQFTGQATTAPLELQIYPGRDGNFTLTEDDGRTLDYQRGSTRKTVFSWNDRTKALSWKISGNYSGDNRFREIKAVLFAPEGSQTKESRLDQDGSVTF